MSPVTWGLAFALLILVSVGGLIFGAFAAGRHSGKADAEIEGRRMEGALEVEDQAIDAHTRDKIAEVRRDAIPAPSTSSLGRLMDDMRELEKKQKK